MSATIEIITQQDLADVVKLGSEKGFYHEIKDIIFNNNISLTNIINLIQMVQESVNNNIIKNTYYKRGFGKNFRYTIQGQKDKYSKMYLQLTQIYYLLRTLFTGETLAFVETIGDTTYVIEQDQWLSLLSTTNSYGGASKIYLKEQELLNIRDQLKTLAESEYFNQKYEPQIILNDMINFASIQDKKDYTRVENTGHALYKKNEKDTLVYLYYINEKKQTHIQYIYNKIKGYNLGDIQENTLNILENQDETFINNLINAEHPISIILSMTHNSISGMVEGDLKTASGQWIQSKRYNETVLTLLNVQNTITQLLNLLLAVQTAMTSANNLSGVLDNLTKKFYAMFSSNKNQIDKKLYDKIRTTLGTLAGEPVL